MPLGDAKKPVKSMDSDDGECEIICLCLASD